MKKILLALTLGASLLYSGMSIPSYAQDGQACNIATLVDMETKAKDQGLTIRDLSKDEEAKVVAVLGPPPIKNFTKMSIVFNDDILMLLIVDNTGCVQLTAGPAPVSSFVGTTGVVPGTKS